MNDSTTTVAALKQLMDDFVAQRQWEPLHDAKNPSASIAMGALRRVFDSTLSLIRCHSSAVIPHVRRPSNRSLSRSRPPFTVLNTR